MYISHQSGTFITTNEPMDLMSVVCIRINSLCCIFCGLRKCIMMYIYHYSILQSSFILKKSVLHLSIPPKSLTPENHWSFHWLHSFAFSRMLNTWNHIVCSFSYWLLSLSNVHLSLFYVFSYLNSAVLYKTVFHCLGVPQVF